LAKHQTFMMATLKGMYGRKRRLAGEGKSNEGPPLAE